MTNSVPTVSVYFGQPQHPIDGFGVALAGCSQLIAQEPPDVQKQIEDLLFSPIDGAGFSLLRMGVSGLKDPQIPIVQAAMGYGVKRLFACSYNQDVPANLQGYAAGMANFVASYAGIGINVTDLSPIDEPSSPPWTGQIFHNLVAALGQALPPSTKVAMPEQGWWNDTLAKETLADPATLQYVSAIGAHGYWSWPSSPLSYLGRPVWQTSDCNIPGSNCNNNSNTVDNFDGINDAMFWATKLDTCLVEGGAHAWFWWFAVNDSSIDPGQGLIHLASPLSGGNFTVAKRLWAIANFSRFIRPGWVRVNAQRNPIQGVSLSAYRTVDYSQWVMVFLNHTTSDVSLHVLFAHATGASVTPYVTSATDDLAQQLAIPIVNNENFPVTLKSHSVTTLVNC